jgi:hypothetical protein
LRILDTQVQPANLLTAALMLSRLLKT